MSGNAGRAELLQLQSLLGLFSRSRVRDGQKIRRSEMNKTVQPTIETENNDCDPLEDWEILTEVVLALVSRPEAVHIEQRPRADAMCFVVHVASEDLGKVIGKNGETVSVLRKLFGRIAATRGEKVFIEIHEPSRASRPSRPTSFRRNAAA
jgi:uncharacterized protein